MVLGAPLRWMLLNPNVKSHAKNSFYVHCYCKTTNRGRWATCGAYTLGTASPRVCTGPGVRFFYLTEDDDEDLLTDEDAMSQDEEEVFCSSWSGSSEGASSLTYASLKRREFSLRRVRVISPDQSHAGRRERDKEEEGGTTGRASKTR